MAAQLCAAGCFLLGAIPVVGDRCLALATDRGGSGKSPVPVTGTPPHAPFSAGGTVAAATAPRSAPQGRQPTTTPSPTTPSALTAAPAVSRSPGSTAPAYPSTRLAASARTSPSGRASGERACTAASPSVRGARPPIPLFGSPASVVESLKRTGERLPAMGPFIERFFGDPPEKLVGESMALVTNEELKEMTKVLQNAVWKAPPEVKAAEFEWRSFLFFAMLLQPSRGPNARMPHQVRDSSLSITGPWPPSKVLRAQFEAIERQYGRGHHTIFDFLRKRLEEVLCDGGQRMMAARMAPTGGWLWAADQRAVEAWDKDLLALLKELVQELTAARENYALQQQKIRLFDPPVRMTGFNRDPRGYPAGAWLDKFRDTVADLASVFQAKLKPSERAPPVLLSFYDWHTCDLETLHAALTSEIAGAASAAIDPVSFNMLRAAAERYLEELKGRGAWAVKALKWRPTAWAE